MIIIPAIDIISGKCVRLFQGDYGKKTVYSDEPVNTALKWESQGAQCLHIVDLDGAKAGRPVNLKLIKSICDSVKIPCELGGGIRTVEDVKMVFESGVSRVILGTVAIEKPDLVRELLRLYDPEKIVIGIDAKNSKVAIKGWLETSEIYVGDLAEQFVEIGLKRFIYTDISKDGSLSGPNYDATIELCKAFPDVKIIASGGVGTVEHIKKLNSLSKDYTNLEAVIVGKALYDNKITLKSIV